MARDEIKSKESRPGFPEYGSEQLDKVNSMRADKTQPDFMGIPILKDGQVMLMSAEALGSKPASCATCTFKNADEENCMLLGPEITVSTVIGDEEYGDPIEYWPCCSMHNYGENQTGEAQYLEPLKSPDELGLIWINASEPGQKYGGANCGGVNGGDDCDHYQVKQGEKWDNPTGFCRVLQKEVGAGQVCAAWGDDDELSWQEAQQLLEKSDNATAKRKLARDIVGRDE
jgi:hypothetical protein